MDYKSSGVDIEEGRRFVENIKAAGASIGAGGFNGLSDSYEFCNFCIDEHRAGFRGGGTDRQLSSPE